MKINIYSSNHDMVKGILSLAHSTDGSGPPPIIEIDGVAHYATKVTINYDTACVTLELIAKPGPPPERPSETPNVINTNVING